MSKQAEFAVILKMNPMFADLGADELQRISGLCHTVQLGSARCCSRRAMPAMPSGPAPNPDRDRASDGSRRRSPSWARDLSARLRADARASADATAGDRRSCSAPREDSGLLEREPKSRSRS